MSERTGDLECLRSERGHDFVAKTIFFLKVLPLAVGTPHQQLVLDCFNDPRSAPHPPVSPIEHQPPREWPTAREELLTELEVRKSSLEWRIRSMKEKERIAREPRYTSEEREQIKREAMEFAEAMLGKRQAENILAGAEYKAKQFKALADYTDPVNLPSVQRDLEQTNATLEYIKSLIDQGKI